MTSRYLSKLEEQISNATERVQQECLVAERAMYLARIGSFDAARRDIAVIQRSNAERPDASVSAWMNTAGAILSHTLGEEDVAYNKLLRARAIAGAARVHRIERIAAAWLAYIEYTRTNTNSMIRFIGEALESGIAPEPIACARACMVIAQSFHLANRYDLAIPWYSASRNHALDVGDELLTSALIHNAAWLHVANRRQLALTNEQTPSDPLGGLVIAAESAGSFDLMIGVRSLDSFVPLLQASAYLLQESFEKALYLYDKYIESGRSQGLMRMSACLYADRAYCLAKLGRISDALDDVSRARDHKSPRDHLDDQATTHARIAQVLWIAGNSEESVADEEIASGLWASYRLFQNRILENLIEVDRFKVQMGIK